jgi:hypothetical protein
MTAFQRYRVPLKLLKHRLDRVRQALYVDIGSPHAVTFVAGMGRSGTTWVSGLINHDYRYRVVFEPFRTEHVPAAKPFGSFAYVRPDDRDPVRVHAIETILSGRTPRGTVDRQHRGLVFQRRIVKAVRSNLMLGWLRSIRPDMPIVLVIRNPFAVAASWARLGWDITTDGTTSELDVILTHPELHDDFPEVSRAMRHVDTSNGLQRLVAQWCILHLVPLRQVAAGAMHVVYYEELLGKPVATVDRLAAYLGVAIDGESRDRALSTATETDFLNRGNAADRSELLNDWNNVLTGSDVDEGRRILSLFGLDHLYDDRGLPATAAHDGRVAT